MLLNKWDICIGEYCPSSLKSLDQICQNLHCSGNPPDLEPVCNIIKAITVAVLNLSQEILFLIGDNTINIPDIFRVFTVLEV